MICAIFLWYQKIFPHKFMPGEKIPYTVIVEKESLVIDKKETERQTETAEGV